MTAFQDLMNRRYLEPINEGDDSIECAEARDEALCRTGADKYNPLVYAMTALMGLFYVVLKLVWFFHLQHQPVGDEEDDMEREEMETNQDQET